jgi:hypothetical protein
VNLSQTQIYVSNLPAHKVNGDRLKAAFAKFGPIADGFVPLRKRFGYITFESHDDMLKALTMNGQQLDEDAAAGGAEPVKVERAREKPAQAAGEEQKKKPKKESKQGAKKDAPAKKPKGANGEATKKRQKAEPKSRQNGGGFVDVQARKDNYNQEIPAKCLLLGYAHRVFEKEEANNDPKAPEMRQDYPGLEWLKNALDVQGLRKSLFFENHTATYSSGEDGESWTVTVDGLDGEEGKQIFSWKNTDPCPEHAAGFDALRRGLLNEAKYSMTLVDTEMRLNRAKIFLLNKLNNIGKAAPKSKKAPKGESAPAPAEEEFDLDAQRAQARANAEKFAASLTPEEAAIYGAKKQVAASGVRQDSDSEDDGGADFAVGGENDCLLADY